jgi:hypothetical protein
MCPSAIPTFSSMFLRLFPHIQPQQASRIPRPNPPPSPKPIRINHWTQNPKNSQQPGFCQSLSRDGRTCTNPKFNQTQPGTIHRESASAPGSTVGRQSATPHFAAAVKTNRSVFRKSRSSVSSPQFCSYAKAYAKQSPGWSGNFRRASAAISACCTLGAAHRIGRAEICSRSCDAI